MTDNEYPVVEGSEHSQVPCIMVHDIEKVTDDVVVEGTPVGDLKEQTAERVVVSEQTVPQKVSLSSSDQINGIDTFFLRPVFDNWPQSNGQTIRSHFQPPIL